MNQALRFSKSISFMASASVLNETGPFLLPFNVGVYSVEYND